MMLTTMTMIVSVRRVVLTAVIFSAMSLGASADRIILAPTGDTLEPEIQQAQFMLATGRSPNNYEWLVYSSPQAIEIEAQRIDLRTEAKKRYAFNLEYPVLTDLLGTPSISVGVRDLLGTGTEHGAFYLAASKKLLLSDRQAKWIRELSVDSGIGTGEIGGLFAGARLKLDDGLNLSAEVYRHRPNVQMGYHLFGALQLQASSLDGSFYYGLMYSVAN